MAANTVRFHRVLKSTPERVYRAFTEADAYTRWLPPFGFTAKIQQFDPKVGGSYKMSFTNFTTGDAHSFSGKYVELVPNQRVRYTNRFDDPNLPGEITTTIDIKKVSVGVEISIVQENLPEAIPAEACYLGWQESLVALAQLVEPEIRQ